MRGWLERLFGSQPPDQELSALMGAGSTYSGDLSFEGRVRVDGHFTGRIYTEDCLEVGVGGVVEGECDVARAIISGRVEGKLRVRDHLLVEPGGFIRGTLDATVVELMPGARLAGEVRITGAPGAILPRPSASAGAAAGIRRSGEEE